MTDDEAVTLRQAIGARVRELRERNGDRQDDVAQVARDLGLPWNRARVGALERGDKAIPVEELVLLPLMLASPDGAPALLDLLPEGDVWVRLGEHTRVRADALRQLVAGEDILTGDVDAPGYAVGVEQIRDFVDSVNAAVGAGRRVWPEATAADVRRARMDAQRDAEQVAARKFGVPARVVSLAAWSRWGRGLTDERDARVADKAPADATPRTLQALRGRVTRELYDELRQVLDDYEAGA